MSIDTVTIIDGGLGRELAKRGAPFRQPEWSALAMIEAPEIVRDVHRAFIFLLQPLSIASAVNIIRLINSYFNNIKGPKNDGFLDLFFMRSLW